MPSVVHPSAGNAGPRPQPMPAHIPGAAPQPVRGKPGSMSTLVASVSIIAAGLVAFYMAQFRIQGMRTPADVKSLTEIPTWQLRQAQQQPEAIPPIPKGKASLYTRQTPDHKPKPSQLPLPGGEAGTSGVAAEILTRSSGKGSDKTQNHPDHIAQPAATKRMNDTGNIYTKNSDYVNSYKRE